MRECVECVPIILWSHFVHIVKLMNKLPCYFYFKSVSQLNQSAIQFYLSSLNSQLTIQFHWPPWNPLTSHVLPVWIRTGGSLNPCISDNDINDALLGPARYQPTFLTWTSMSRDGLNAREGLLGRLKDKSYGKRYARIWFSRHVRPWCRKPENVGTT